MGHCKGAGAVKKTGRGQSRSDFRIIHPFETEIHGDSPQKHVICTRARTHKHTHTQFCRQVQAVHRPLVAPPGLYTQVLGQERELRKDRAGGM